MKKVLLSLFTFYSVLALGQTITLQPDGAAGKDSRIWSKADMMDNNAGSLNYMGASAWTWNGDPGVMRMLVDFDLSSLPAGAQITDAKLTLSHFTVAGMDNGDNALFIKRITSSWDESTVTWNNKPSTTETNKVSVPAFATGENMTDVDVTALVSDMVANPSSSDGFLIMLQTEQTFRTFNAATSENTDASVRPKLVITYTVSNGCLTLQPDGTAGKDSRIWSKADMVDNNAGSLNYMGASAWTWNGDPGVMRMLVDFDLSSLPAGAQITDAKLTLSHFTVAGMDNGDNALFIKRITSSWDESTVTWNNKPSTTETNKVSVPAFATGENMTDVDVTALVSDMVANPSSSGGFLIMLQTEQTFRTFNAASSENTDASVRPKLEVCYSVATGLASSKDTQLNVNVYPNPYSENSVVNFTISESDNFTIEVMNSEGKLIKALANQYYTKGDHSVELSLDKSNCKPGIYFVRIISNDRGYSAKMVVE